MGDTTLGATPYTPASAGEPGITRRVWAMLFVRLLLFLTLQFTLAGAFAAAGFDSPIQESAKWWLWFVTISNVVCVVLLARFMRAEGSSLRSLYGFTRATWFPVPPRTCRTCCG